MLGLLPIVYDCPPYTMVIWDVLRERCVSDTMCNIELQNKANFSYCMYYHISLFWIVISTPVTVTTITVTTITITTITITTIIITTITITTITITIITITTIAYLTRRLLFHTPNVPHHCQLSAKQDTLLHWKRELLWQAISNPLLTASFQRMLIYCF